MSEIAELLERFRRGGEFLASLTTGAAGPELDFLPASGAMSIRSIVCHLMDGEMVQHGALSAIIAEDSPTLPAFDAAAWAARLNYRNRKFSTAVEMFRRVRTENYDLLKDLPADTWSRTGHHPAHGTLSLLDAFYRHLEHTESQILLIREIRGEYKASRQSGTTA